MKALLTICLLFVCFGGITGIPRGGNMIASHCKDLHPAHAGTTPQTGQAPYNITTSIDLSTGYIPNTQYTVTLISFTSSVLPRGFIIQFRNYDNLTTVGAYTSWNSSLATTANCDRVGDTLTQDNAARVFLPDTISFTWQAPSAGTGPIRIWSSFVNVFSTYWVNGYVSDFIPEAGGGAAVTVAPPASVVVDLSTCGSSKGCYRLPSGCTGQSTCSYIYTQRVLTVNTVQYTEIELSTTSPGWAAIGYSVDKTMGGIDRSPPDDVLACQNTGSRVQVKNGWILASDGSRFHSLDNTSDVQQDITTVGASYSNGVLACRFRRRLFTGSPRDKDLRVPFYQFYVWDPTPGGLLSTLPYHATNRPVVSNLNITVSETRIDLSMSAGTSVTTCFLLVTLATILGLLS